MNIAELITSIAYKINSIKGSVTNAYSAARGKGATLPAEQNMFNLADTIRTIQVNKEVVVMDVQDENLIIDNYDIFFIDHFGIAGAYTKEEVAKWTEIEFQPKEYEFLDFYGFTETLEDIQDGRVHTVGVLYTPPEYCVMYVNVRVGDEIVIPRSDTTNTAWGYSAPDFSWNPTLLVDWGDGTITKYEYNAHVSGYSHTYEKNGIFPIIMPPRQGWTRTSLLLKDYNLYKIYAYYFPNGTTTLQTNAERYAQYVLLPPTFNSYGSNFCNAAINLEVLVMPNVATTIGYNFALNAEKLKFLVFSKSTNSSIGSFLGNVNTLKVIDFPDSFNWIGNVNKETRRVKFPKNYSGDIDITEGLGLKDIVFPDSMKIDSLTVRALQKKLVVPEGCTSFTMTWNYTSCFVQELYLPSTLKSISYTGNISYLHLAANIPPTLANSSYIIASKIYVPYSEDHSILAAYQSATNWSALASKIEEESV